MNKDIKKQKVYDGHESRIRTYKQEERRLSLVVKELTKIEKKAVGDAKDAKERYNDILDTLPEANKKVSDKKKEVTEVEQLLANVKAKIDKEKQDIKAEKELIATQINDIANQKGFYDEQMKSYRNMVDSLADERREVQKLKDTSQKEIHETVKTHNEWKKKCKALEMEMAKLASEIAEYDQMKEGAKVEKENYESLLKAHATDEKEITQLKTNLERAVMDYDEKCVELQAEKKDVEEREKVVDALKLSFEKQIEALDEERQRLEILKLKLNKAVEKHKLQDELAELKR